MKIITPRNCRLAMMLAGMLLAGAAVAEPDGKSEPVAPKAKDHPLKEIWSGYHFQSEETRAQQDDADANPAMEHYKAGEKFWSKVAGKSKKSCSSCHGDAAKSMRGAGTRFPLYYPISKRMINVEDRINLCREKFMGAKPWDLGSKELLALSVFVKRQSLGARVTPQTSGPAANFFDKGKTFYTTRRGQLDMACTHCHDKYAGKKLRGLTLTQGQSNGYPAYRKTPGKTVSLGQQINACLIRVRAAPLAAGSEDLLNLETYLAWRGQGLPVETPAVRE